jgi:hypothetical protein
MAMGRRAHEEAMREYHREINMPFGVSTAEEALAYERLKTERAKKQLGVKENDFLPYPGKIFFKRSMMYEIMNDLERY